MSLLKKIKKYAKKVTFVLGLCGILAWIVMGIGTSLAWFRDTSPQLNNIFHFADFEVEVSYRTPQGGWAILEGDTEIFNSAARYEPNHTQVVFLKAENIGDRAFQLQTSVAVTDSNESTNVLGESFRLQNYLKFGLAVFDTEADMIAAFENRESAQSFAVNPLNQYAKQVPSVAPQQTVYFALVVTMPESVGNVANFDDGEIPMVELGVVVRADQIRN